MPRLIVAVFFLFMAAVGSCPLQAQAEDPSELYVSVWRSVQEGEKLEGSGRLAEALARYRFAGSLLDQLQQNAPDFQPLIVEFRKRKTSEAIQKLQEKIALSDSSQAPAQQNPLMEEPLPENGPNLGVPTGEPTGGDDVENATRKILNRISELQQQLKETKKQVDSLQNEKEAVTERLSKVVKELERTKTAEAESKTRQLEVEKVLSTMNAMEKRGGGETDKLVEKLRAEEIEREAVAERNEDLSRRASKAQKLALSTTKERDEANSKLQQLQTKLKKLDQLAADLQAREQEVESLKKENKQQVATFQRERAEIAKERATLETKQKQLEVLQKENAAAKEQVAAITRERDKAMAELAKTKDAQAQVDKLLADNAALMQKLSETENSVRQFNADLPKKDEQIANLQREVSSTKELLAAAQKENSAFQSSMAELQAKLEAANKTLADVKNNPSITPEERGKLTQENTLLRGIVLKELKEQARREQSKKLVLEELAKLEARSDVLLQQIDYLSQPVVKLSEEEKALFKDPQIQINEADPSSMAITIAAPKSSTPEQPATATQSPAPETSAPAQEQPAAPETAANTPAPEASANAAAPAETLAGNEAPANPGKSSVTLTSGTAQSEDLPIKDNVAAKPKPAAASSIPGVPEVLVPIAREAKEAFERGRYRDAEKAYQRILSKEPNNVYALSNLGVVRFRAGKLPLAEEAFRKAIAIAPEDYFSHCTLGIVYYQQDKLDEAVAALTRALALNSKNAVAHNYLGITASKKGWNEAAQKELETAIALDPKYADAHFNLAVLFATQKPPNKEQAMRFYKRATDLGAEPDTVLESMLK